jgi:type II secretory pathway component GspD/PulD (secretin)
MNRKELRFTLILLSCLCLIWANPAPSLAVQADQDQTIRTAAQEPASKIPGFVIKTYTLKHINPEELLKATRVLLEDASFSDKMVTVKIWNTQIPKFEELLNKLDVEKKTIQFRVFAIVASRERMEERKMQEIKERPREVAQVSELPSPSPKTIPADKEKYIGEPISLKFKEADLRDVLAYLADFARLNLVLDADVRGIVTCNLENIPWDQALDIVLRQNNMGKAIEGKIIRVAPLRILGRERYPEKGDAIENKDLKKVLDELKTLWNFKTYEVDGPSFLTVQEDSGPNNFKLVTNRQLNLVVSNAKVTGEEPGKRTITIEQLKLTGMTNFVDYVFVDTHDVTLKERGYLVAGVSGYGSASNALILVINAEIK